MKKIILAFSFMIACSTVNAQNDFGALKVKRQPNIPVEVKTSFQKDFPNTNGEWEKEDGNYEVNFKTEGMPASAIYDKTGRRMETEISIAADKLPAGVSEYIKKNYPAHKLSGTFTIVNEKNITVYECELMKDKKRTDLIFDESGKFLKIENEKKD